MDRAQIERRLKASAEAIRASESKLRATFNALGEGVVLLDSDGRVVDGNAAAQRILGYSTSSPRWWRSVPDSRFGMSSSACPVETASSSGSW
jgi:PAS domain-containing protein